MLAISRLIPTDTGPSAIIIKKKKVSQHLAHSDLIHGVHKNWLRNPP